MTAKKLQQYHLSSCPKHISKSHKVCMNLSVPLYQLQYHTLVRVLNWIVDTRISGLRFHSPQDTLLITRLSLVWGFWKAIPRI